jgi:hypothetical protein
MKLFNESKMIFEVKSIFRKAYRKINIVRTENVGGLVLINPELQESKKRSSETLLLKLSFRLLKDINRAYFIDLSPGRSFISATAHNHSPETMHIIIARNRKIGIQNFYKSISSRGNTQILSLDETILAITSQDSSAHEIVVHFDTDFRLFQKSTPKMFDKASTLIISSRIPDRAESSAKYEKIIRQLLKNNYNFIFIVHFSVGEKCARNPKVQIISGFETYLNLSKLDEVYGLCALKSDDENDIQRALDLLRSWKVSLQ